jgi:CDP-diacylglycerol--glycerol-3-phosphate 3-phosphatidyltransferase
MSQQKIPPSLRVLTLPNVLTAFRILCIPLVIVFVLQDTPLSKKLAAICFGIAAVTDFFDGYLARHLKETTLIGKIMDPLADKFLSTTALVLLQWQATLHPIVVIMFLLREFAVTTLRAMAAESGIFVRPSSLAKWKTAVQLFGLPFMMSQLSIPWCRLFELGQLLVGLSLGLSYLTGVDYFYRFFYEQWKDSAKKSPF